MLQIDPRSRFSYHLKWVGKTVSRIICPRIPGALFIVVSLLSGGGLGSAAAVGDPWLKTQLISPEALNKQLGERKGEKPVIIHVGFRALYVQGHIPGALYSGPASKPQGLAALKQQTRGLPRHKEIILYCGCCPMRECPNIRPAFKALKELGLTRISVVSLPTSFAVDWAGRGYPAEKGK
jgi:thiosulfate/3-mercaptopyruvate sulfurtransferase